MNIKVWRECSPRKTDKELLGGAGTRFISNNLGTLMKQTKMLGKQSPVSMLLSGLRCLGSRDPCAGAGERTGVDVCYRAKTTEARSQGLRASLGEKPAESMVRTVWFGREQEGRWVGE